MPCICFTLYLETKCKDPRWRVVITSPCACMHACAKAQCGAVFTHSMAECI
jgi:hypothetical protein